MVLEPQNRLAQIFKQMGIAQIKPTEAQLEKWGMSITRFNQLVANEGRINIRVQEANLLRTWLKEHFNPRYHYLFEDELPHPQQVGKQEKLQLH